MKKTAVMIRCVPRYGFDNTEVRAVDLDVPRDADEQILHQALAFYFSSIGIANAVYDLDVDDDGYFAIINDDVYEVRWGRPLL